MPQLHSLAPEWERELLECGLGCLPVIALEEPYTHHVAVSEIDSQAPYLQCLYQVITSKTRFSRYIEAYTDSQRLKFTHSLLLISNYTRV